MWQCLSFPRSLDFTQWISTNAQLDALVSRRLPCNEGWINFEVRQNKPVLQCFNLLRAPVPRYKTQCKPGQLFTYVLKTTNTGTPKEQKELSTFYNSGSGFLFVFFTLPITMLSGCSRGQDPVFRVLELPVVHMTIFSSEPNNAQKCFTPLRLTPTGYAADSHFSKE